MIAAAAIADAFPDVPGLALEPMTEAHLDEAAHLEVEAGFRRPCDGDHSMWPADLVGPLPPCEGPLSHIRAALADDLEVEDGWCLRLSFQDRTLQYVMLQLDVATHVAEHRLLLRASRERPAWFWREAARPIFAALAAAGVTQFQDWIPPEDPSATSAFARRRRRWIEKHFAAAYTGEWRRGGARCWGMPVDLQHFTGWPERRTVGFEQTAGRLRVWEATDADLPAVRALIDTTVPVARKPIALRMVDEWWALDRAACLLGARDGELRYARAIRPRAGAVAGFSILAAVFDEPEQRQMGQTVLRWCKAAGYTHVTGFIPTATMQVAGVQQLMAASPYRVVAEHRHLREPFTEIEIPT